MSNRESRYDWVARIAYQLAQKTVPRYSHAKRLHPLDNIPPMRRHGQLVTPDLKARRSGRCARLDGVYGQRWKSETVRSVIKRKFGDAIRSRRHWHQHRESAVKGLVYNLHR